jgi:hypothetical protein
VLGRIGIGIKHLIKICANLSGRDHRFKIRALTIPGRLKYSLEEHKNILLHEDKEEGKNKDT